MIKATNAFASTANKDEAAPDPLKRTAVSHVMNWVPRECLQ